MPPRPRILTKSEPPRERFKRVAEPRVSKILDHLRNLADMNRSEYGAGSDVFRADVEHMIAAIERGVGELKEAMRRPPGTPKAAFSFDDVQVPTYRPSKRQ